MLTARTGAELTAFVAAHQRNPHAPGPGPRGRRALPCVHEEAIREPCPSCSYEAGQGRHVRGCALHETCTREVVSDRVQACSECPDYVPDVPAWDRRAPLRFDHTTLHPHLPGKRFNPALVADGAGYVFAWRDGWAGSDIWLCRLDRDFRPVGDPVKPNLSHPAANYGREDPQLFVFGGRLHMAFVGVRGGSRRSFADQTHVLYTEIRPDLTAGAVLHPHPPGVQPGRWEKNWEWFEHGDQLYAVYSISPHRVLKVTGDACEWAANTLYPHRWTGGEQRGGTSPARVGDEWWCFFHDSIGARKLYRVGLYTFEDEPPFRVKRFIPYPIAAANLTQAHDNYCDVIFPRGAVRSGDDWLLSCGVHDRWSEIHALRHADLEKQLVPVS